MLAERADEVCGKLISLVEVSADLAYPSVALFLELSLRLGFDVSKVVCVGHGRIIVQYNGFCNLCNEQSMCAIVVHVNNLTGHICVGSCGDVCQSVCGVCIAYRNVLVELVHFLTGLESEVLEGIHDCRL